MTDRTYSQAEADALIAGVSANLLEAYRQLAYEFCYISCSEKWDAPLEEHNPPCQQAHRVLATPPDAARLALEEREKNIRVLLLEGFNIISSAYAHVSHGGPTREEALAWIRKVEKYGV
jgi:hypothetical protein